MENITREEATKLLLKVFDVFAPRIPLNVKNVMISATIAGMIMEFAVGNYEWEYNLDIGVKRFRDKRFGPWTKWSPLEA